MWNELDLDEPSGDLCEYGQKDAKTIDDLSELVSILTSASEILSENHPIWEEIKIFKNVQVKYKRILHCDKCLQLLQRVGSCLRKMVLLNLSAVYLNLAEKIIMEIQNPKEGSYFLPSCQQLEYVLIRTQSAAKLICESLRYSRETFCYLIQKLKVGHLVINLMMATSVTARLNIVFKSLLIHLFDSYKKLYVWRKRLRKGGWEWPKPLELPEDLETWLNVEESEYIKPKHLPKEELDFLTSIFDENSQTISPSVEDQTESQKEDQEDIVLLESSKPSENSAMTVDDECMVFEEDNAEANDDGVIVARSEMETYNYETSNTEESLAHNSLQPNMGSSDSSNVHESATLQNGKSSKLRKTQILSKKIKKAETIKDLKIIWENLDLNSLDLLPKVLTPETIRLVDKLFHRMKHRISQLNASNMSVNERDEESKFLIKIARLKFAKYLGLLNMKSGTLQQKEITIKPAKTFKQLRKLYETLYHRLQTAQKYKKCAKLKKSFKHSRADIRLLVENGERASAKKLICDTSKLFLSKFQ